MLVELAIICGRVRKFIRVREFAATHTLEQMRRVRMLEKQSAWKREGSFDRIETIAEIYEEIVRRLHAGFDPEPFCTGLYNPRRPPSPEEFTPDLKVEVVSLRMELLLSQPLPLAQYDFPPRRSPAAGKGLDEPGEPPLDMQQTDRGSTFSFQADVDGFEHVGCKRIPEEG